MFLRRLGKRGTAIVEYAIILAFAAAVGSSFNYGLYGKASVTLPQFVDELIEKGTAKQSV